MKQNSESIPDGCLQDIGTAITSLALGIGGSSFAIEKLQNIVNVHAVGEQLLHRTTVSGLVVTGIATASRPLIRKLGTTNSSID